jgi:hypothetical protein
VIVARAEDSTAPHIADRRVLVAPRAARSMMA